MTLLTNRRNFIRSSTLTAGAVTLLGSSRNMYASLPVTDRFSLSDPASTLLDNIALYNHTVMQGFAFDNTNKCILTAQVIEGGIQLPGESSARSSDYRSQHGGLCITKLSLSGSIQGHMYLQGFGHGVSIGAEPSGSSTYLWVECDAPVAAAGGDAHGIAIARIKFVNGAVYDTSDVGTSTIPGSSKYTLVSGSTNNWPSIDPVNNRLMLHYTQGTTGRYRVYNLADVKAGSTTSLISPVYSPSAPEGGSYQGCTIYGSYAYMLSGDRYAQCPRASGDDGNAYITILDLNNNGTFPASAQTNFAPNLMYREPEGMAIQIPDITKPNKLRLCFGAASVRTCGGGTGTQEDKYMHIGYKDVLI